MAKTPTDIRSLARSHTRLAIGTLVGVMVNPKAMSSAKVAASREMLNRGWGQAQPDEFAGDNRLVINILQLATQGAAEQPTVNIRQLATEYGQSGSQPPAMADEGP